MSPTCSAVNCYNRDGRETRSKGITFHKFPTYNAELLKKWLTNMKKDNWYPNKRSTLCSNHFSKEMFDKTGQNTRLRENAFPVIFDFSSSPEKRGRKSYSRSDKKEVEVHDEIEELLELFDGREEPAENEEALPSKRRIKRKKRDDEIIEWGSKKRRTEDVETRRPSGRRKTTDDDEEEAETRRSFIVRKSTSLSPAKIKVNQSRSNGLNKNGRLDEKDKNVNTSLKTTAIKKEPISEEERSEAAPSPELGSRKKWTSLLDKSPQKNPADDKLPVVVVSPLSMEHLEASNNHEVSTEEDEEEEVAEDIPSEWEVEEEEEEEEESMEEEDEEGKTSKKWRSRSCFARSCNHNNTNTSRKGVTFHKFPSRDKSPDRYSAWVTKCGRDKDPSAYSLLCSTHFEEHCLDRTGQIVRLRPWAVPTLFTLTKKLVSRKQKQIKPDPDYSPTEAVTPVKCMKKIKTEKTTESSSNQENSPATRDRVIMLPNNRMYFEFSKPKTKVILQIKPTMTEQPQKVVVDKEFKSVTLGQLLKSLKVKDLLTNSAEEVLKALGNYPEGLEKIKEKTKDNRAKNSKIPKAVAKFAATIYFHAPESYSFVQSLFVLPEKKAVQQSLRCKGYFPGFTLEALKLLKEALAEPPEDMCTLMLDIMPIRQEKTFVDSSKRWIGHVDFGGGLDPEESDGIPLASEILTLTAVGLTREWKIPFGYFLMNRACGEVLHQVVKEAIAILEECGLKVRMLVCDGSPQTVDMADHLGCQVNCTQIRDFVNGFDHPFDDQRKIHIAFGIQHSVDMLRDLIVSKAILRSQTYGIARWAFYDSLFGNKRCKQPKDFYSLSPQLYRLQQIVRQCHPSFNSMICEAFELATDLNLEEFAESEPTVNLFSDVYRAFDMMNSRNPVTMGDKPPITHPYVAEQLEAMTVIAQRMLGLETFCGLSIAKEGRWMSVASLAFTLKAACHIASETLLNQGQQKYLATYRMNMDHSDMILSCLQRCGGWEGIPTAAEFRRGYKAFFESCVKPSKIHLFSNDFDGDDLTVGQGVICPFRRGVKIPPYDALEFGSSFYGVIGLETGIILRAKCVLQHLSRRLSCTECMDMLLDDTVKISDNKNIDFYQVIPSAFLIRVLKVTDKELPKVMQRSPQSNTEQVVVWSFTRCLDLFKDTQYLSGRHVLEEPHHIVGLMKAIIRTFVNYKFSVTSHRSSIEARLMKGER